MQQQPQLWPADVQSFTAFELYAGLVQSRAFHMLAENWITGSAKEGALLKHLQPMICQLCFRKAQCCNSYHCTREIGHQLSTCQPHLLCNVLDQSCFTS